MLDYIIYVVGVLLIVGVVVLVKVGMRLDYLSKVKSQAELALVEQHPFLMAPDYFQQLQEMSRQHQAFQGEQGEQGEQEELSFNIKANSSQLKFNHLNSTKTKDMSLYNYIYDQHDDQLSLQQSQSNPQQSQQPSSQEQQPQQQTHQLPSLEQSTGRLKLIKKYIQGPEVLFQNMILANYNTVDQLFNEKRNRNAREYPKYFLPRGGHLSVLSLSFFLYVFYFLGLNSYLLSLNQTMAVAVAVPLLFLNLAITFYYNATLVKYLVMPYFYSLQDKTKQDNLDYSFNQQTPRLNLIAKNKLQQELKEKGEQEPKGEKGKEGEEEGDNKQSQEDTDVINNHNQDSIENQEINSNQQKDEEDLEEQMNLEQLKSFNNFKTKFETNYFYIQNYQDEHQLDQTDNENIACLYMEQEQNTFHDLQVFLLTLICLTTIFYLYLCITRRQNGLYVLVYVVLLWVVENAVCKPLLCQAISWVYARYVCKQIPGEQQQARQDFVVEFVCQQDHVHQVYQDKLNEMDEELERRRQKNLDKYKNNGLFVIEEEDEAEERKRKKAFLKELRNTQQLNDDNHEVTSMKSEQLDQNGNPNKQPRPLTGDLALKEQEDKAKKEGQEKQALSRQVSIDSNNQMLDSLDQDDHISSHQVSVRQDMTQHRNLNKREEMERLRRKEKERQRLEEIKRQEEERRLENFRKQKELEKELERKRLAEYKRLKELKRQKERQEYLDYMEKLEREKQNLYEKRREYSELRNQLLVAKDNMMNDTSTKQNQHNYALLQKQLREKEQQLQLEQYQLNQKLEQAEKQRKKREEKNKKHNEGKGEEEGDPLEGTLQNLNSMLNPDNDKSYSNLNMTQIIKHDESIQFNELQPNTTLSKAGLELVNDKKKNQKLNREQQNNLLLEELGLGTNKFSTRDHKMQKKSQSRNNISIADQSMIMMDLNNTQQNINHSQIKKKSRSQNKYQNDNDNIILDEPFMLGAQNFLKKLGKYKNDQVSKSKTLRQKLEEKSGKKPQNEFINLREDPDSTVVNLKSFLKKDASFCKDTSYIKDD